MQDRSLRVIPLASQLLKLVSEESDSEVQVAAFDVFKVAMDHRRRALKPSKSAAMGRAVLKVLNEGASHD